MGIIIFAHEDFIWLDLHKRINCLSVLLCIQGSRRSTTISLPRGNKNPRRTSLHVSAQLWDFGGNSSVFLFSLLFLGSGLDINVLIGGTANFPAGHFTHVFIDEAEAWKCRTKAGVQNPPWQNNLRWISNEFVFRWTTYWVTFDENPYWNPRKGGSLTVKFARNQFPMEVWQECLVWPGE